MTTALQTVPKPADVGPDTARNKKLLAGAIAASAGAGLLARKMKKKKEEKENTVKEAGFVSGMEKAAIDLKSALGVEESRKKKFRDAVQKYQAAFDAQGGGDRPGQSQRAADKANKKAYEAKDKMKRSEELLKSWAEKKRTGKIKPATT